MTALFESENDNYGVMLGAYNEFLIRHIFSFLLIGLY